MGAVRPPQLFVAGEIAVVGPFNTSDRYGLVENAV